MIAPPVAKAWPIAEAESLAAKLGRSPPTKGYVLFAAGYGPSGLPHIGTFCEVLRTTMVMNAFRRLDKNIKCKLFVFSDDMDALRKVPENVPNRKMLEENLQKPLSSIPDPFGEAMSFAAHNNAALCRFLDDFGFDYEFKSATAAYKNGDYDEMLKKTLSRHEQIRDLVAAELGEERRRTYSPFLPIHEGRVLQAEVIAADWKTATITYIHPQSGDELRTSVLGGNCKLQWKADWAMRWAAYGVDYEMAGKDLIDSVRVSAKIARRLGAVPPLEFIYELFLDENGEKISKSIGNGITIDQWLRYAPRESLAYFLYHRPKRAKRLYFDVIPKATDEYLTALKTRHRQNETERAQNPIDHLCFAAAAMPEQTPSFSMLLNLVTAVGGGDADFLWGFVNQGYPKLRADKYPKFDELVERAVVYFTDFIKPTLKPRRPNGDERRALLELAQTLEKMVKENPNGEEIQTAVYEIGKKHRFEPLRRWFITLYEVLLGSSQGARFGSFVALYGIAATATLIRRRCDA